MGNSLSIYEMDDEMGLMSDSKHETWLYTAPWDGSMIRTQRDTCACSSMSGSWVARSTSRCSTSMLNTKPVRQPYLHQF
jgi:hypothetical protein